VTGVRETSFFEVTTQSNKYQVRDVTDTYLAFLDEDAILGDIDLDGEVTIKDVTVLISCLMNDTASTLSLDVADLNGDDRITIIDVTQLINMLMNGI
jgi:hypothetical protein